MVVPAADLDEEGLPGGAKGVARADDACDLIQLCENGVSENPVVRSGAVAIASEYTR